MGPIYIWIDATALATNIDDLQTGVWSEVKLLKHPTRKPR